MCYCHRQEAQHARLADAPCSLIHSVMQLLWLRAAVPPSRPQRFALGAGTGAEGREPPAGEQ